MKKIVYGLYSNRNLNYDNSVYIRINEFEAAGFPYDVEVLAENLQIPWAIDISEEGTIYFTERNGNIRIIENGRLDPQLLITLTAPFVSRGEGGLMGIALDPDFQWNHYLYVMHSYLEGNRILNRVIRLIEQDHRAFLDRILIDTIPGGQIHNGGRIKIGPDLRLYITTGDAGNSMLAQDLSSLAGKILRIERNGDIPEDNPFVNSAVYSYGHRNPQGLAWSSNQLMYASEHGQSAHDEINRIVAGANYGWPIVQGDEVSNTIESQRPILQSGRYTWAPSGIAVLKEGPWQGQLAVAALRGEQLLEITLNEEGTGVQSVNAWLVNEFGRLREVIQGEDGSIYIATNNRDGRGNISPGDDKILRLIPKLA